jgi:hypothetical protein
MILRSIPTVATVVLLSACTGGRSSGPPDNPDPAAPDAGNGETPSPLADAGPIVLDDGGVLLPDGAVGPLDAAPTDGCATPPLGSFTGHAREGENGAGGGSYTRVDITWNLASSTACIDRYTPSGTVRYHLAGHWCSQVIDPISGDVEPTDGELVIDRSTNPASYTIRGTSFYDTAVYCEGDPPPPPSQHGGRWVDASGTFDGAVLAGGLEDEDDESEFMRWRFLRTDVVFTPPGAECSEPPRDAFTTSFAEGPQTHADVIWTRVSTEGCLDRFVPASGTAWAPIEWHETCVNESWEPQSAPVEPTDGELRVDRSTDPATFWVQGGSSWPATWTCTENGITHVQARTLGDRWADLEMDFDGTRWSGAYDDIWRSRSWSFAP